MKQLPSISYLHQRIDYNPITGECVWNRRAGVTRGERRWNTIFAGELVGTIDEGGYRTTALEESHFKVHRIVWKMTYGEDPLCEIDHINGDKNDNRIRNLREATSSQNSMNRRKAKNCTSGSKGVGWAKREGRWQAQIETQGKAHWLGYFDNKEDAKAAYDRAANDLFGKFARES